MFVSTPAWNAKVVKTLRELRLTRPGLMVGVAHLPDEDVVAEERHLVTSAVSPGTEQLGCSTLDLDVAPLTN
jgi:hypothetical protein